MNTFRLEIKNRNHNMKVDRLADEIENNARYIRSGFRPFSSPIRGLLTDYRRYQFQLAKDIREAINS